MAARKRLIAASVASGLTFLIVVSIAMVGTLVLADDHTREPPLGDPVEAIVDFTPRGIAKWRSTLGPDCRFFDVFVLVLGSSARGYDVVTLPGDCQLARLTVTPSDGGVRTEDPLTRED
jgi:hypothetical protein